MRALPSFSCTIPRVGTTKWQPLEGTSVVGAAFHRTPCSPFKSRVVLFGPLFLAQIAFRKGSTMGLYGPGLAPVGPGEPQRNPSPLTPPIAERLRLERSIEKKDEDLATCPGRYKLVGPGSIKSQPMAAPQKLIQKDIFSEKNILSIIC